MKLFIKLILLLIFTTYVLSDNKVLGEACTSGTDTCTTENTGCTGGKCTCNTGYGEKGNACVQKKAVGTDCNAATDLCIDNAECSTKCKCKSGYYAKSNACVANVALEGTCTAGTDTCIDNAECKESKCKCKDGYTAKNSKCESNSNSNVDDDKDDSGSSFLKVYIISLLLLLF